MTDGAGNVAKAIIPVRLRAMDVRAILRFAVALAALLVTVGCGDDDDGGGPAPTATATATAVPTPTATPEPLDFDATAEDFECIRDWELVRGFRITNKLGLLEEALELARTPEVGGQYPVGTIIQLFPGEAMVKRGERFDPDNNNWEYFELDVSAAGTEIRVRGRDDVVNRFGGQCFGCHAGARDFDFICESGRGCVDLGLSPDLLDAIRNADPRCGES